MAQEGEGDNSAAAAEEGAAARGRHNGQPSQAVAQPGWPRPANAGKAGTATSGPCVVTAHCLRTHRYHAEREF